MVYNIATDAAAVFDNTLPTIIAFKTFSLLICAFKQVKIKKTYVRPK